MANRRYHPTLVMKLVSRLRALSFLAAAGLLAAACATSGPGHDVIIDGEFDEWKHVPVVASDPADAPDGYLDFGDIRVRHDRDSVFMMVELGRVLTAQRLPGTVSILLDVDGRSSSGHEEGGLDGVDLIFDFPLPNSKSPGTPGAGVRLRSKQERLNPYSLGVIFAPVHAGDRFEFRFNRRGPLGTTPPIFFAPTFRGKIVAVDLEGKLVDETPIFTYKLKPTTATARRAGNGHNPIARAKDTDFRVLCWNVSRNEIFEKPKAFGRILVALWPDVIIFDEVSDKGSLEQVRAILAEAFLSDDWNLYYGPGGADQRTVIATRNSIAAAAPFSPVVWPEGAVEELASLRASADALEKTRAWLAATVPAGGAIVTMNTRSLLAAGVDLQCCGGHLTIEDHRRMVEARAVNAAAAATAASAKVDAIVIAGDFNLVGDPSVLSIVAAGLDNGQPLTRVRALQLDGMSDATWANPEEPFVPGRLDHILYSAGSLQLLRSFVFDSSDLSGRWLAYNGLTAEDSRNSSDHLPVVADFQWK